MARVAGEAGRHACKQASKKWVLVCVFLCGGEFVIGAFTAAFLFWRNWVVSSILIAAFLALLAVGKRIFTELERDTRSWEKGAEGEIMVGKALALDLPDSYYVIHDLNTEYGNLDHVVIGPTGVFVVETKACRGLVTDDGHGELLLNGEPKPCVREFTGKIMSIRKRWIGLADTDRFIQGVIVFALAWEKTNWGKTGNVHCINIDRIPKYFLEQKPQGRLEPKEVERLSRAFLALAKMDEDFKAVPAALT